MWNTFVNAWRNPEIRKKLLFTLMIVVIYRFGSVAILIPGIDTEGLARAVRYVLGVGKPPWVL